MKSACFQRAKATAAPTPVVVRAAVSLAAAVIVVAATVVLAGVEVVAVVRKRRVRANGHPEANVSSRAHDPQVNPQPLVVPAQRPLVSVVRNRNAAERVAAVAAAAAVAAVLVAVPVVPAVADRAAARMVVPAVALVVRVRGARHKERRVRLLRWRTRHQNPPR